MIRPLLGRPLIEHRLREVHDRLRRAREELAIIDEQLISLEETAEDARIRSLVSETPLAERDWIEAQRHADAARRSKETTVALIGELEKRRDELLARLPPAAGLGGKPF